MFVGPYEIDKETSIDDKYVEVSYKDIKDGDEIKSFPNEMFNKEVLEAVKTKEPEDFNSVRDKRCYIIVEEILKTLHDKNAKASEINFICQTVVMSVNNNEEEVLKKLLGKTMDDMTFHEHHQILTK